MINIRDFKNHLTLLNDSQNLKNKFILFNFTTFTYYPSKPILSSFFHKPPIIF